jgi:ATP-dependent DNA ligase
MVAGPDGRASFEFLRRGGWVKPTVFLCAFDLLMIEGEDLRAEPIEGRKAQLAHLRGGSGPGAAAKPAP